MIWRVRRVVTGHDSQGRSTFISDAEAANVKQVPAMPGLALTELWETRGAPASNEGDADAADILRIVEFPPDSQWRTARSREAFKAIGASHAPDRSSSDPMMHKTSTVDYIVVLKGEIFAIMETGEKRLRAGDVLVQRGTNHSWSVRGNEPCIVAVVLVSAKPVVSPKKSRRKAKKMK